MNFRGIRVAVANNAGPQGLHLSRLLALTFNKRINKSSIIKAQQNQILKGSKLAVESAEAPKQMLVLGPLPWPLPYP